MPFLATGFGAFLMRQAFLTLPHELRDAAALDGYGHWRFLWRVAVPLARPAVAALTVFAFLAAWNQYLWPLLITKDDQLRTVQIGLKQLQQTSIDQLNITFAGAVIAVIPLVILLLFFQKQLVRGLTAGAVQGLDRPTSGPDAGVRCHRPCWGPHPGSTGECTCVVAALAGFGAGGDRAGRGVVGDGDGRPRRRGEQHQCPLSALKKAAQAGRDHHVALDDRARTRRRCRSSPTSSTRRSPT